MVMKCFCGFSRQKIYTILRKKNSLIFCGHATILA